MLKQIGLVAGGVILLLIFLVLILWLSSSPAGAAGLVGLAFNLHF
jgi:hypothetical protein